jgi:uncharacterized protein YbjT (DUF2867 family)
MSSMRVVVFGATGTVGRALLPRLADEHEAVPRQPRDGNVTWAQADVLDALVDRLPGVATVARDERIRSLVPLEPTPFDAAVRAALADRTG